MATTAENVGGAAAAAPGLPQLDPAYWPGQIFWLLVTFAVLYLVMSRLLLPRVRSMLDERAGRIAGDMEEARRLRTEAQLQSDAAEADLAEARARATRLANDAKARAAAESAARRQAQEAELHAQLTAAEARIRIARDEGMSHVRAIAGESATAIAERLTGLAPTVAELDAALAANPRAA